LSTDTTPTERYVAVQRSEEFGELRRRLRRFVFPTTVAFILWYALYVLLSAYARDFMGIKLVGNINVALVIAWYYARYAADRLDPIADKIQSELETTATPVSVTEPDEPSGDRSVK
jgi:uncharacterized membrane protein (DUF485 family)